MRLFVRLTPTLWDDLYEVSRRELRHPRDQAALFIAAGLRRAREAEARIHQPDQSKRIAR